MALEERLSDERPVSDVTLERSLARMHAALSRATALGTPPVQALARARASRWWGGAFLVLSAGSVALLAATGAAFLLPIAVGFGVGGGVLFGRDVFARRPWRPDAPAHIGMGATVSSSAVVEPGATIEMGATVRSGATIRSGAVVGMGATVGANATVESGAQVGWGATVRAGAVLGANSIVGWGATVGKGVQVPAGTRLRMGATVSAGWLRELLPGNPEPRPVLSTGRDPAELRAAAVCDRLASELRAAPEHVRSFLGASDATITSLRRTCEDLFRREQVLRAEVDPVAVSRVEQDKKTLEERLSTETDERIRQSLAGAVAALSEQQRQRELLRLSAERLQAERMRLVYTLEGLAAQFVRLRTAGAEASRVSGTELEQGVKDLGAELDAIADALEEESQATPTGATRIRG